MFITIPLILIFFCVVFFVVLVIQKIPHLRVMNPDMIPKERTKKMKEKILLQKFERTQGERLKGVMNVIASVSRLTSQIGRRLVQRLYALEQSYQKMKRNTTEGMHAYDTETIRDRVTHAEQLIVKEEYIPAEKIFIDIISHNPKCVDAYEGLGNLYLANHQLEQANETFQFTLRISPNDASVFVSLAELELMKDQPKTALTYLKKAIQKRPKNPKYLDFYIETSLKAGSLKDAQDGIKRLKEVNPENQKIPVFEERFLEQKNAYQKKTHLSSQDTQLPTDDVV